MTRFVSKPSSWLVLREIFTTTVSTLTSLPEDRHPRLPTLYNPFPFAACIHTSGEKLQHLKFELGPFLENGVKGSIVLSVVFQDLQLLYLQVYRIIIVARVPLYHAAGLLVVSF